MPPITRALRCLSKSRGLNGDLLTSTCMQRLSCRLPRHSVPSCRCALSHAVCFLCARVRLCVPINLTSLLQDVDVSKLHQELEWFYEKFNKRQLHRVPVIVDEFRKRGGMPFFSAPLYTNTHITTDIQQTNKHTYINIQQATPPCPSHF